MFNRRNEIEIEGKMYYLIDELETITKGKFYMVESMEDGESNTKIIRKVGKNFEIIIEKSHNNLDTEIIDYYDDVVCCYGNAHLI